MSNNIKNNVVIINELGDNLAVAFKHTIDNSHKRFALLRNNRIVLESNNVDVVLNILNKGVNKWKYGKR